MRYDRERPFPLLLFSLRTCARMQRNPTAPGYSAADVTLYHHSLSFIRAK